MVAFSVQLILFVFAKKKKGFQLVRGVPEINFGIREHMLLALLFLFQNWNVIMSSMCISFCDMNRWNDMTIGQSGI